MEIKKTDIFLFAGQSNMAGRGISTSKHPELPPKVTENAGFEYRAVTAPDCLSELSEPFGVNENIATGINDGNMKTGSMVSAFINAYYAKTAVPVTAVSASKGGSSILLWQPGTPFLKDALNRLNKCRNFLFENKISVRHVFMLWCQGETDGDNRMTAEEYIMYFNRMLDEFLKNGIEKCFMVKIGHYNGSKNNDYTEIRNAQSEIALKNTDVIMVSDLFETMKEKELMKDDFHYFQKAYNIVGTDAGNNTGEYVNKNYSK